MDFLDTYNCYADKSNVVQPTFPNFDGIMAAGVGDSVRRRGQRSITGRVCFQPSFDTTFEAFGEDATFVGKPKMLKFTADSDEDEDNTVRVDLMEMVCGVGGKASPFGQRHQPHSPLPFDPSRTPNSHHGRTSSSCLWDSGLGSPTPGSSPKMTAVSPFHSSGVKDSNCCRGSYISPIPLIQYDSDEDGAAAGAGGTTPWSGAATATPDTPPHRRMKSLRLYDNPQTPKSLLQRSQRRCFREAHAVTAQLHDTFEEGYDGDEKLGHEFSRRRGSVKSRKLLDPAGPQTNINPFTFLSTGGRTGLKRSREEASRNDDSLMEDSGCVEQPCKRLALREMNTSRYLEEFHQVCKIGDGEFGSVYDCVNRLDGCHYAIKKSKTPVAESIFERNALNEVYAHAVLGKHVHVVRYFSAWAENGHMYIQNEFCNGGSLASVIAERRVSRRLFLEVELVDILLQVARGLKYIHSNNLVHLDIKPANIFIHKELLPSDTETDDSQESFDSLDSKALSLGRVTYKIGDLGHVTSVISPLVEEGDCRYLPDEILQERYEDLPKADIFCLALTIYEAASLAELPKNGPEWHDLRELGLPTVAHLSGDLNALLKSMASYDHKKRPSSASLVHHPVLVPAHLRTRAELYRELKVEKLKNEMLTKELVEVRQAIEHKPACTAIPSLVRNSRILGRKCARSASLTAF